MKKFQEIIKQFKKQDVIPLDSNGRYDPKIIGKTFYSSLDDGKFIYIMSSTKSVSTPVNVFKSVFDEMMSTFSDNEKALTDIESFKDKIQEDIQTSITKLNELITKKENDADVIEKEVKSEITRLLGNKIALIEEKMEERVRKIEDNVRKKADVDIEKLIKDKLDEIAKPVYSIREHMLLYGNLPTIDERIKLEQHYKVISGFDGTP